MAGPSLRYLSAADVRRAMPPLEERLELARRSMVGLVEDAELPPKLGVHPAPTDSFAHAMPAWLRGAATDGSEDLLGMKWVVGFPTNAPRGIATIHGTILLSDATTGRPRAVLDAGPVTAERTAAVSGVAIERWGPPRERPPEVAVVGSGVQARSHLPIVAHLLPAARLRLFGRDRDRLEALATDARAGTFGSIAFEDVRTTTDLVAAVEGADLVITLVSFGPQRQLVPAAPFGSAATIVAVDYDVCVPAGVVTDAELFLTDDRDQFLANRTGPRFVGYPDPGATIGEALLAATRRPPGRVVVTHLGVGLADVVFGDAIVRRAEAEGVGTILD